MVLDGDSLQRRVQLNFEYDSKMARFAAHNCSTTSIWSLSTFARLDEWWEAESHFESTGSQCHGQAVCRGVSCENGAICHRDCVASSQDGWFTTSTAFCNSAAWLPQPSAATKLTQVVAYQPRLMKVFLGTQSTANTEIRFCQICWLGLVDTKSLPPYSGWRGQTWDKRGDKRCVKIS